MNFCHCFDKLPRDFLKGFDVKAFVRICEALPIRLTFSRSIRVRVFRSFLLIAPRLSGSR